MDIEQKASDVIENEDQEKTINKGLNDIKESQELPKSRNILDLLKSPTGDGPILDYMEHPLNYNNSKYVAQLIRGLSGIFGRLDLAIIDIGMGLFGFFTDRKQNV
jgi:hypothetical protein